MSGNFYLVGGCVRDALLGRSCFEGGSFDIDIATNLLPHDVRHRLRRHNIDPSGLAHGTVKVLLPPWTVDITTFRRDVQTDGRHARVTFCQKIDEDASRRDFTMNAIYMSSTGELFDPVNGLRDLQNGLLRFIGEPRQRILEDHLRILRLLRFWACGYAARVDNASLYAALSCAHLLNRLSGQRIWAEMSKILTSRHGLSSKAEPLWRVVFGGRVYDKLDIKEFYVLRRTGIKEPLLLLAGLLSSVPGEDVVSLLARFKFSKRDRKRVKDMCCADCPMTERAWNDWVTLGRLDREAKFMTFPSVGSDVLRVIDALSLPRGRVISVCRRAWYHALCYKALTGVVAGCEDIG